MTRLTKRRILVLLCSLLALLALGELGARWLGLIDFPLYHADARIGYIPKAEQHGDFMDRNHWAFNALQMGVEEEFDKVPAGPDGEWLVIGDSVVLGGNAYAQGERLGPQLQKRVKATVWPISAGSWSLQNELAYLEDHPDVVQRVNTILFVVNSGDLVPASSWACSWTHPREKPASALWYLAGKYVLKLPCEGTPKELQVAPRDPVELLKAFHGRIGETKQVVFFLYPDRDEAQSKAKASAGLDPLDRAIRAAGFSKIVRVADSPDWKGGAALYRDEIHPTAPATAILAGIMAAATAKPHEARP